MKLLSFFIWPLCCLSSVAMTGVRARNVSGDRYWFHRYL